MLSAHAGNIDEAATILLPLLVVIAFVVQERRNVRKLREQQEAESQEPSDAAVPPSAAEPDRP